jgi:hypothetical protein
MEILDETEDLIFTWITTLPMNDQRAITSSSAIINCMDDEAEEEIKNEIWETIKNSVSYNAILNRLNVHLNNIIETPGDSEEEEDEVITDNESYNTNE